MQESCLSSDQEQAHAVQLSIMFHLGSAPMADRQDGDDVTIGDWSVIVQ